MIFSRTWEALRDAEEAEDVAIGRRHRVLGDGRVPAGDAYINHILANVWILSDGGSGERQQEDCGAHGWGKQVSVYVMTSITAICLLYPPFVTFAKA